MKMRRNLLTLLALAGCSRPDAWDRSRQVIGPIPMKDLVAYVDTARDRVVTVDVRGTTPKAETYAVGRQPLAAQPTPDRSKLMVLTHGQEAIEQGQTDEAPGLYMIDAVNGGTPIRYEIGSPFDKLAVADDGSVAVAYFSAGGPDGSGLFRNPNELAIIDLASPPSTSPDAPNPVLRSVRSFGDAPLGVVLSPPITIPGATDVTPRTLAFVFSPNLVTILDASHPDRSEISVRLTTSSTDATVTPLELAFAPGAGTAYLRADGARDVLQIVLSAVTPGADGNDFHPSLTELGAHAAPADIAVYDGTDGVRRVIAATPGTRQIAVIEADTAQFMTIPTLDPVDRILLLPPDAPRVAVFASISTQAPRVQVLPLDDVLGGLIPVELTTMDLAKPVFDIVAVPGDVRALVVHDDTRTVLGLLDLTTATVAPLEGSGRLDTYDFATNASVSYLVGATRYVARVGMIDLTNLHPTDVRLDNDPSQVFAMPNGSIFVDHGDPYGLATILPSASATRADATVFSGFLVADLLDEKL
jgi:hypothetical protein